MCRFLALSICVLAFLGIAAIARDAGAVAPAVPAAPQFVWHPEIAPEGPVVVIVTLDEQRAYVYRNGIGIGASKISSGRAGHRTPTGVFSILQKEREHYSNKYDNAPMPFMERLTWDGIALHGGHLPGYPASHGCIRLPAAFAQQLFTVTQRGQIVVVAGAGSAPVTVVHPALLAPVTPAGLDITLPGDGGVFWDGELEREGPVSVLVGLDDKMVFVLRNGIIVGSSPLTVEEGLTLTGSILFVVEPGFEAVSSRLDATQPRHKWTMYPIDAQGPPPALDELAAKLHVREDFARNLYGLLTPGTTILVTSGRVTGTPATSASMETVLEAGKDGAMLAH